MQEENEKLVKFNNDFRKTYENILKEKRILEQEHVKFNERIYELEREVKILKHHKEVIKPCKRCEELTLEVTFLNDKVSKLETESLSFSKYKKSTNDFEEIIIRKKCPKIREVLDFQNKVKPLPRV